MISSVLVSAFFLVDLAVLAIFSVVGLFGLRASIYVLRLEEMRELRYIWEPGIVSGVFLYLLLIGQTVGHYESWIPNNVYYEAMSAFVYVGVVTYVIIALRFTKIVSSFLSVQRKAKDEAARLKKSTANESETIQELIKEKKQRSSH